MAGTTIGEVSVNLRMSVVQFQKDTKEAAKDAERAGKQIKDEIGAGSDHARASLALLGEEIGLKMPRHLRSAIAELPGVSTALNAAFSSVAVVAFIGVVIEAGKKLYEMSQAAQKMYEDVSKASGKAFHELAQQQREAERALLSPADKIREELKDIKVNGELAAKSIGQLTAARKALLDTERDTMVSTPNGPQKIGTYHPYGPNSPEVQALEKQISQEQQAIGTRDAQRLKLEKDLTKALKEEGDKRTSDAKQAYDKDFQNYRDEVEAKQKIAKQSKITLPYPHVDPNSPALNVPAPEKTMWGTDIVQQGPFPKLEPGATKPIYSGDQGALELEKIRTNQQAQIDAANKVKESVESVNQKFREQVELLTTLREKGRITGEEYDKAMKKAKEEATHTNAAWKELGKSVSEDITQAILFESSWTSALKAVLAELIKVVLQMTLLKALKKSMDDDEEGGGGGGGGIFGAFVHGIFGGGRASGGPLESGKWYIAGERGPEPIWGGGAGAFAMGYAGAGAEGLVVHNHYQIDARGSSITEEQFKQSLTIVHDRAVRDATKSVEERRRRR